MTTANLTSPNIFNQILVRIIKDQTGIIGPLAWQEAKKVDGLHVIDQKKWQVEMQGDGKEIVNRLVIQYSKLFGQTTIEACKEAVQDLLIDLPPMQIPKSLQ